jgi:hypothetical protein
MEEVEEDGRGCERVEAGRGSGEGRRREEEEREA